MKNFTFYIISFICGGVLISSELIGVKLIAPYFGVSIYVWTSVLISTLLGLSAGYYAGGKLSVKKWLPALSVIILVLSFMMLTLNSYGKLAGETFVSMPVTTGCFLASFMILFPLLMLFGMISPLIIGAIKENIQSEGMISGLVFFISSAGGVFFTFITGWYLIPEKGIRATTFYMTALLSIALLLSLFTVYAGRKKAV